ncbi:hypothetical protein GCM10029964_086730 [Kibdelosporangium lantanae]
MRTVYGAELAIGWSAPQNGIPDPQGEQCQPFEQRKTPGHGISAEFWHGTGYHASGRVSQRARRSSGSRIERQRFRTSDAFGTLMR